MFIASYGLWFYFFGLLPSFILSKLSINYAHNFLVFVPLLSYFIFGSGFYSILSNVFVSSKIDEGYIIFSFLGYQLAKFDLKNTEIMKLERGNFTLWKNGKFSEISISSPWNESIVVRSRDGEIKELIFSPLDFTHTYDHIKSAQQEAISLKALSSGE